MFSASTTLTRTPIRTGPTLTGSGSSGKEVNDMALFRRTSRPRGWGELSDIEQELFLETVRHRRALHEQPRTPRQEPFRARFDR